MSNQQWIVVTDWDRFQHPDAARSTALPWVKTYTELLSNDEYLNLPAGTRAVLHGLWLEYARSRCRLRLDTASLRRRLNLRVTKQQLEALNDAGFIHFSASKPASTELDKKRGESLVESRKGQAGGNRPARLGGPGDVSGFYAQLGVELKKPSG